MGREAANEFKQQLSRKHAWGLGGQPCMPNFDNEVQQAKAEKLAAEARKRDIRMKAVRERRQRPRVNIYDTPTLATIQRQALKVPTSAYLNEKRLQELQTFTLEFRHRKS